MGSESSKPEYINQACFGVSNFHYCLSFKLFLVLLSFYLLNPKEILFKN